jgi:hypothetical protein
MVFAGSGYAETPEEKGLRIAQETRDQGEGFGSVEAVGEMVLRDARGRSSSRAFVSQTLDGTGDVEDKGLIVFREPRDIEGTALLTHSNTERDDDQWIFLPAFNRVRRISASGQSNSFVGSEFSFEDMRSPTVEKYSYRWLRDEPCPGAPGLTCWVNERFPNDRESGYSRIVSWIDQDEYRIWKADYYNRRGEFLKTLTVSEFRLYKNRFWRAHILRMENHQNSKSTDLVWNTYDFEVRLNERDFTTRALERSRPF